MTMTISNLMKPKPLDYYKELTQGGNFQVSLTQKQAVVVLKAHDHGIAQLATEESAL